MSASTGEVRAASTKTRSLGLAREHWEIAGYGAVGVTLFLLLWFQVRRVNGFYLDEWVYLGAAQDIWRHFPGGLVGPIPLWDRGVQRAYSTLLSPLVGLQGRSAAYTEGHIINVLLLAGVAIPAAAFIARRVIAAPFLRVLAVGLALIVPWAMISAHLLTECLTYTVFLWTCLAIVRAAEVPTVGRQTVALGSIVGLVVCRVDLGVVAGALVLASLGGELLRPRSEWSWRVALRRQAPILALLAVGIVGAIYLLGPGSTRLGRYGTLDLHAVGSRLFGAESGTTRGTMEAYTRSLVLGTLILPFALGLATALAGVAGRLGRRVGIVSIVAFAILVLVVGGVSTAGGALEERYVFYAVPMLSILAVAGVERARQLWPWAIASGAFSLWVVAHATILPANDSGNFFAAPAGAFWTRVADYRVRKVEHDLFGWLGIAPRGWLLIAVALVVLVVTLAFARRWPRQSWLALVAASVLCLAGQAMILSYSLHDELNGTVSAPGGIASGARETFVDKALPSGKRTAIVPAVVSAINPGGAAERLTFWNGKIDATVALGWDGAPVPAPPGFQVVGSRIDSDGVASLTGTLPQYLTAQVDDPRAQFASRLVKRSPDSDYGLFAAPSRRALWTAQGVQADGAVITRSPAILTVDRSAGVRSARLTLLAPEGYPRPEGWRIRAGARTVVSGTLRNGDQRTVILRVPRCGQAGGCSPAWSWRLETTGSGVPLSMPGYGPVGPPRKVAFFISAAHLDVGTPLR